MKYFVCYECKKVERVTNDVPEMLHCHKGIAFKLIEIREEEVSSFKDWAKIGGKL